MLSLLIVLSAQGACPASSADVVAAIDDAEAAFGDLDVDGFRAASDRAAADVACLSETLPRSVTARLHRVQGLRAFTDDDPVGASAAFASARAIAPTYRFPEGLVPAGHPVREQYTLQDPLSGGEAAVPPPADGQIEVDGKVGAALPRTRPSVVQWARADGTVPSSAYLRPGDALFDYEVATDAALSDAAAPAPAPVPVATARAHTSVPLAIGAGVLLAAAAGSYAVSAGARRDYLDTTSRDDLEPLRARTNSFFIGSMAIGGTGLALGASAVLVGKW